MQSTRAAPANLASFALLDEGALTQIKHLQELMTEFYELLKGAEWKFSRTQTDIL
jgi:hypothetical protein